MAVLRCHTMPMADFWWVLVCGVCHGDGMHMHRWSRGVCRLCGGVGVFRPHERSLSVTRAVADLMSGTDSIVRSAS